MVPEVAPGCWKKEIPESIRGWKGFFIDFSLGIFLLPQVCFVLDFG